MTYIDKHTNLKGQVILIDAFIHKKAKLTRKEFLDRVRSVKYIRARPTKYLSFYITSVDEYSSFIKFHDLINKGKFDFDDKYVFAIAVQPKLYEWFKTNDYATIEKQIVSWLAALYYFQPDKRHIVQEQLYKLLFEEILNVVDKYYKNFPPSNFKQTKKCNQKYLQVCKEFYNGEPPAFLKSPFHYEHIEEWGLSFHHSFSFDIVQAYFREDDWEHIILKEQQDDMQRAESRDDLWEKWKHTFETFDQRRNFVYSFYFDSIKKQKREIIPDDVKNKVWTRDGGKCVECGSNQKLEFDHIIPFSKGGSSTYRNIQLLCEKHNREKHNKLGDD